MRPQIKWLARDVQTDLRRLPWDIAINSLAASFWVPRIFRTLIYRLAGIDVALSSNLMPGTIIRANHLTIEPGSTINHRCYFDNRVRVTIGMNVGVGPEVAFITSSHDPSNPFGRAGAGSLASIHRAGWVVSSGRDV